MNKSDLSPIEKEVKKQLDSFFPEEESPHFIAGISGGPDSMVLLYIFKQLGIQSLVVHINYQKRGEESEKDAELVEQMAFQWGFDCHTVSVNSEDASGKNFQQWARHIRYDIFHSLKEKVKADGIALAHHEDDQIETILQKQFRGAGLASWTGMKVWDGKLFRPFLSISQAAISQFVEKERIPYRIDKSNLESDFARNFLRNEWLHDLEMHFPGWRKNVLRTAEQATLFENALQWIAEKISAEGLDLTFNRKALLKLNPGLRKALVLYRIKEMDPDTQVGTDALRQLDDIDFLQTGKAIQLSGGLRLGRDRDRIILIHERDSSQQGFSGFELHQEHLMNKSYRVEGLTLHIEDFSHPDYQHKLYLDITKIRWPLRLRLWRDGDQFQPFGMEGHQKVSDHLTNRKVSTTEKKKALVLESFAETIHAVIFPPSGQWVPPGTISELVRCDDSTGKCLTIKRIV